MIKNVITLLVFLLAINGKAQTGTGTGTIQGTIQNKENETLPAITVTL